MKLYHKVSFILALSFLIGTDTYTKSFFSTTTRLQYPGPFLSFYRTLYKSMLLDAEVSKPLANFFSLFLAHDSHANVSFLTTFLFPTNKKATLLKPKKQNDTLNNQFWASVLSDAEWYLAQKLNIEEYIQNNRLVKWCNKQNFTIKNKFNIDLSVSDNLLEFANLAGIYGFKRLKNGQWDGFSPWALSVPIVIRFNAESTAPVQFKNFSQNQD